MKNKLSFRLSAGFAAIVLATVALVSLLANLLISRQFEKYVERQQESFAQSLADSLRDQFDEQTGEWNLDYIHGFGMYALNDGYIIKLYDREETAVWDAQNHDMTLCRQVMNDIYLRMEKQKPRTEGAFVTKRYALKRAGYAIGYADISYYSPYAFDENDFRFVDSLNRILGAVGIFCLAAAVLAGMVFARHICRPLEQTMEITREISNGNYEIRANPETTTTELAELIGSVNSLAGALKRQEELRRQQSRDVAHELRTPLANVAAHLEAMLEGVWEPNSARLQGCYDEICRISGIVTDLEKLEAVEAEGTELKRKPVDLKKLSIAVRASFEAELSAKHLTCLIKGESAVVWGDEKRLHQAVFNLLSNAVKYSAEGGQIRIIIETDESEAVLIVEDQGIGIAKEELPLVFERFYRTDRSRSRQTGGAGIGLAIVKSIVQAHGGSIAAESREGEGSRFILRLPNKKTE